MKPLDNKEELNLLRSAVKAADDKKAEDIAILEVSNISPVADYFVICTASNPIHARAIADAVEEALEQRGKVKTEGKAESSWILIDAGPVIIHVMLERLRKLYHLERFWSGGHPIPIEEILPGGR